MKEVTGMAKRKVKFKIFKISNLITNTEKNKTIYNYYNHRIVDFILLNILSHEKKDRKKLIIIRRKLYIC